MTRASDSLEKQRRIEDDERRTTRSEPQPESLIDTLVTVIREAEDAYRAAQDAAEVRDAALDRLCDLVGGDRLAAIQNGHRRLGRLVVSSRRQSP